MPNYLLKRGFVIGIIVLLLGLSVNPSTGTIVEDQIDLNDNKTEIHSERISSIDNDTEYYALLIGMGIYAFNHDLDHPSMVIEAENLKERLLVSEHWKEENIKVITGRRATFLNVIRGFRWLDKREDENDISVVCISTHGAQLSRDKFPFDEKDGRDEILITHMGGLFPWLLNIRDDLFSLLLSSLDSRGVCVVIGACFAGGFNDTPFTKAQMNNMNADKFSLEFAAEISGSGRVILMACQEDELSYPGFIWYFAKGLMGYADINDDNLVSAEEAFEYTKEIYTINGTNPMMFDDYPGELQLTIVELPPTVPETPSGQTFGDTNTTYSYSTVSTDPESGKISYGWDWNGDFEADEWTDFVDSNTTVNNSHSWTVEGIYNVRVIAKDEIGLYSEWSDHIDVIMCDENIPDQMQRETDWGCWFYGTWLAQSFVPSKDKLSKVEIALSGYGQGDSKTLQIYIRDNLSGDNLAESSQDIPELGDDKWSWYAFDFMDINVIPGETYYIVCMGRNDWTFNWKWKKDNPYVYGKTFWSEDGNEWYPYYHPLYDVDSCFVTWSKI